MIADDEEGRVARGLHRRGRDRRDRRVVGRDDPLASGLAVLRGPAARGAGGRGTGCSRPRPVRAAGRRCLRRRPRSGVGRVQPRLLPAAVGRAGARGGRRARVRDGQPAARLAGRVRARRPAPVPAAAQTVRARREQRCGPGLHRASVAPLLVGAAADRQRRRRSGGARPARGRARPRPRNPLAAALVRRRPRARLHP